MIEYRNLRVALLGAGSVGSQVARLLLEQGDEFASRVGARLELVGLAVRAVYAPRAVAPRAAGSGVGGPGGRPTGWKAKTRPRRLVIRPDADLSPTGRPVQGNKRLRGHVCFV